MKNCKYCGALVDTIKDDKCGCNEERIAELKAQLTAAYARAEGLESTLTSLRKEASLLRERNDSQHIEWSKKLTAANARIEGLKLRATAVVEDNYLCTDKKPDSFDSYGINGVLLWQLRQELKLEQEKSDE